MLEKPEMLAAVARYLAELRYTGTFCIDFLVADRDYMIDMNPRFFGSWPALQLAGVPLLEAYLDHVSGRAASRRESVVALGKPIW